jgi:hypothetical protein
MDIPMKPCERCGEPIGEAFHFCLDCHRKDPNLAAAFGSTLRQPEGFNPPPLELRSPEPKQGQMLAECH